MTANTETRPSVQPPSGEQVELRHGDQRAVVVEVGGGLRRYDVGDWAVLDGYGEDEMCSAARGQPLIPWPNRLGDGHYAFGGEEHQLPLSEPAGGNAIHGLVRWSAWWVAERSASRAVMEHVLHPQAGYPFRLRLRIAYELGPNGLTVTTTARNDGPTALPYGSGMHPYVSVGTDRVDDVLLRAPGRTRLESDDRGLPTGRTSVAGSRFDFREPRRLGDVELDTAFTDVVRAPRGPATVTLRNPFDGREAGLWLDEAYPYVELFTGDSLPQPERRRRSLGIEPMTCPPDAFRTGEDLRVLAPGERATARWGLTARTVA